MIYLALVAVGLAGLLFIEWLGRPEPHPRLTYEQADAIEDEMRALEADPATTVHQMRLFMQHPMPCGHATGNLLTCPTTPYGCAICGEPEL